MSAAKKRHLEVRLLFVDEGSWHRETIHLAPELLDEYDRLIDCLREEPRVLERIYVDVDRLSGAWVVDDD
jgi:hypothetical protein